MMLAPFVNRRLRKKQAPPPVLEAEHVPAPTGGLNALDAAGDMPATDAFQLINLISSEYGLRTRLGSREHATLLDTAAVVIRSLFYFHGSAKDGTKDRVFAVTTAGIYDVSTSGIYWVGATPSAWASATVYAGFDYVESGGNVYRCSQAGGTSGAVAPSGTTTFADNGILWDYVGAITAPDLAFSTTTGDAGRGVFHAFVTSAGHFLAYCDEENGFYLYAESTDSWAVGSVNNVAEEDLVYVTEWKGRLWFAERDSANAWYLDAGAISGDATKLPLEYAAKFRHGGDLVAIATWTGDGGNGMDDRIIFIGRGGDVAIYEGTDPDSASTFALKGTWYVGAFPEGRHVASPFGGDVLLLTQNGVRAVSVLVSGGAEGSGQYVTRKIANLFNALMVTRSSLHGWAMHLHPEDNCLMVSVPSVDGSSMQLVMSLANGSWSLYQDLPMHSGAVGAKKMWLGSLTGRVLINDGYIDGIRLDAPGDYTPVTWSVVTSFRNQNARFKKIELIRPTILSQSGEATWAADARYAFDTTAVTVSEASLVDAGEWDGAVWDEDVWSGEYTTTQGVRGASGVGTDMAIAARGLAVGRTVLVGFDVMFQQGGVL